MNKFELPQNKKCGLIVSLRCPNHQCEKSLYLKAAICIEAAGANAYCSSVLANLPVGRNVTIDTCSACSAIYNFLEY